MKTELVDFKTAHDLVRGFEQFEGVLVAYYIDRESKLGVVQVFKDIDSSVPISVFTFNVSRKDLLILAGL